MTLLTVLMSMAAASTDGMLQSPNAPFVFTGTLQSRRNIILETPVGQVATTRWTVKIDEQLSGSVKKPFLELVVPGGRTDTHLMWTRHTPPTTSGQSVLVFGQEYRFGKDTISPGPVGFYFIREGAVYNAAGDPVECVPTLQEAGVCQQHELVSAEAVLGWLRETVKDSKVEMEGLSKPNTFDEKINFNDFYKE